MAEEWKNPGLGPHPDENRGIYSNHRQANRTKELVRQVHEGDRETQRKAKEELEKIHGSPEAAIKAANAIVHGSGGRIKKLFGR